MANIGIPPQPPVDSQLSLTTWGWLKFVWSWIRGEANVTPSNTTSITLSDSLVYPFDTTAGSLVATLPLASSYLGKKYVIKKTDSSANTVTITASGSDLIDGTATKVLSTQYAELEIASDGVSKWHIFAFYTTGAISGPGGANTQVQFNDGGAFGGSANFTFNKTTNVLTLTGSETVSSTLAVTGELSTLGDLGVGTTSTNQFSGTGRAITLQSVSGTAIEQISTAPDAAGISVGELEFDYKTNSASYQRVALIGAVTEGATVNQRGAYMVFYTQKNAVAGLQERMRIDNAGNVGIGRTPTIGLLDINGATTIRGLELLTAGHSIQFNRPDDTNQFQIGYTSNDLLLRWNYNAGATTMSLDSSGNISIPYATAYQFAGINAIENVSGLDGYTRIRSGTNLSTTQFLIGGSTDPATYSDNTTHLFRNIGGGTTFAKINSAGLDFPVGAKLSEAGNTVFTFNNLTTAVSVDLAFQTDGKSIKVAEGGAATKMGLATLVLGVSVVGTTSVTAQSRIFLSVESLGTVTVPTVVAVTARTPGTSFTITSANLTDTSKVAWLLVEPA